MATVQAQSHGPTEIEAPTVGYGSFLAFCGVMLGAGFGLGIVAARRSARPGKIQALINRELGVPTHAEKIENATIAAEVEGYGIGEGAEATKEDMGLAVRALGVGTVAVVAVMGTVGAGILYALGVKNPKDFRHRMENSLQQHTVPLNEYGRSVNPNPAKGEAEEEEES